MLGFVNGRSCAHKSKPRGLVNKKPDSHNWKSGAKLVLFYKIGNKSE